MSSNVVYEFISWDLFGGFSMHIISLIDGVCFFAVYVCLCMLPVGFMDGICSYIYHTNQTNLGLFCMPDKINSYQILFGKSFAILDVWISYRIYIIYLKNRHRYPRSTQCNYVRFTYIYPWNCTQIDKVEGISINHMHIKCLWYIRCATERQPTGNLSSHVVKRRRFVEVPRLWKLHQRSCHLREHLPRQRRTPGFQKAEKQPTVWTCITVLPPFLFTYSKWVIFFDIVEC